MGPPSVFLHRAIWSVISPDTIDSTEDGAMSSTPRTAEHPGRSSVIKVYVTPGEKRRIRCIAQELDCSMSEFVHANGVGGDAAEALRHRVDLRMLTVQLRTLLESITPPETISHRETIEQPCKGSRPVVDGALAADVRVLVEAAGQALQTILGDTAHRASAGDVSLCPKSR